VRKVTVHSAPLNGSIRRSDRRNTRSADRENVLELLKQYDLWWTLHNFPTRYLLNDASVFLGKRCAREHLRFEPGQRVSIPVTARYRCLYPQPPRRRWRPIARKAACWACCWRH